MTNSSIFNRSSNSNSNNLSFTSLTLQNSTIIIVPPKNWVQFNFTLSSVGAVGFQASGKIEIQIVRIDKLL